MPDDLNAPILAVVSAVVFLAIVGATAVTALDEIGNVNNQFIEASVIEIPEPVAWFKLDETSGSTTFTNEVGSNHGSCNTTSCPSQVLGKRGHGQKFDGIDDKISVLNSSGVSISSPVTLSVWVKVESCTNAPGDNRLFEKSNSYILAISRNSCRPASNLIEVGFSNIVTLGPITMNEWHMLTVTYDNPNYRFYIDGEIANETTADIPILETSANLTIGNRVAGDRGLMGSLDDLIIYDQALSPAEIRYLYSPNQAQSLSSIYVLLGLTLGILSLVVFVGLIGSEWRKTI